MRTRGMITCFADGLLAPGGAALITVGIWIVPEGTAATVLADPRSDENADWFYYSTFAIAYEEHVTDVIHNPVVSGYREVIDSKAMRISDSDTEVQMVVVNTTITSALTVNFAA